MTEQEKEKMEELRKNGLGYRKIAKELNYSVSTVSSYFIRQAEKAQKTRSVCRNCGTVIKQTKGHRQRIYCSERCRYLWNKKHPEMQNLKAYYHFECLECGTEFFSYGNSKRLYCCRQCYLNAHMKNRKKYHDTGV